MHRHNEHENDTWGNPNRRRPFDLDASVPGHLRAYHVCSKHQRRAVLAKHRNGAYLIQYRATLNTNDSWVNLTNNYPAATNTNRTTFVIYGAVPHPPTNSGGGGWSDPTDPVGDSLTQAGNDYVPYPLDDATVQYLAQFKVVPPYIWDRQHRSPYIWELQMRPPMPYDFDSFWSSYTSREHVPVAIQPAWDYFQAARQCGLIPSVSSEMSTASTMETLDLVASFAFFRVCKLSPTAVPDIFSVQQNSGANQLGIFGNDFAPDDDAFFISDLTAASHGDIQYTVDATTFTYAPNSGHFGPDSFTYSVTNLAGAGETTTVSVFVNKTGNHSPSAPPLLIVFPTDVWSTNLNALANATDSDADTISFVSVSKPKWGSLLTNTSGQITYLRKSNVFYPQDSFSYYLTDGKGGLANVPVSILFTDNDGDGMPDDWEVLVGLNTALDDSNGDPDGDGLPTLAEFFLQTSPVSSSANPLNLSITNGTSLSGFVQLLLPSLVPNIEAGPLTLYVNGSPAANCPLLQGADGRWSLGWDTTFLTNGTYSIKAGFQYKANSAVGETNTLFGDTKTIVVVNEIIFDQLTTKFTDFLLINVRLANRTNTDWLVELYDDYGNPLVWAEDTTTDGKIQLYWDLTDGFGNQISFGNIQVIFYLSNPGEQSIGPGSPSAAHWFLKERTTTGDGFVVAWGWHRYTSYFNNNRGQMMLDAVINIIGDPSIFDEYTLAPSLNIPYASTFRYDTDSDKQTLTNALKNNNNFFWFGHGSFNTIAGNDKKSSLSPADVTCLLENYSYASTPKRPKTDKHPYRLVILNGCETYASLWAGAFGINFAPEGSTNIVLEYQFSGRTPRAFVGWTAQVEVPDNDISGGVHAAYGVALAELFSRWMGGYPLEFCMDFFADSAISSGFSHQDKWKISGCTDLQRHNP